MSAPERLFFVTDDDKRIPFDVKYSHTTDGTRYWIPVIEADLDKLMPSVVAIEGPPVHVGECLTFVTPGPGWDSAEWGRRVMANSRAVFGWYVDHERQEEFR